MQTKIYLDNSAGTVVAPEVIEAMLQEFHSLPGNPSSVHTFGKQAKKRLIKYREEIASYCGVKENEVIFTSGGTESMNLLLRGMFSHAPSGHAISSSIEHPSVYHTLLDLQKKGLDITFLTPQKTGEIRSQQVEEALQPNTQFVALSAANSETGVKNDLEAIASVCEKNKIPFLVDGVAWLGKEPFSLPSGITGIGFSGHKIHAPPGTGFALIRSSCKLFPSYTGALQEYGLRPGTENLPGIAGLAKAISLLSLSSIEKMRSLRDFLENNLLASVEGAQVNGGIEMRVSNLLNISLGRGIGEELLIGLDRAGIAVSHGSACASGSLEPSRVLTQMGVAYPLAKSALRFSLSRYTTQEEIEYTLKTTIELIRCLI